MHPFLPSVILCFPSFPSQKIRINSLYTLVCGLVHFQLLSAACLVMLALTSLPMLGNIFIALIAVGVFWFFLLLVLFFFFLQFLTI